MMKQVSSVFFFLLLVLPLWSFTPPSYPVPARDGRIPIRTVVIDPGHGGTFTGAQGLFSQEKDVSLKVALKFGKALQEAFPDIKVVYTRTTDANAGNKTTLREDLNYRADLANQSGGDLFISFHCNSAGRAPGGWYEKEITKRIPHYRTVKKGKRTVREKYYTYHYRTYWVENEAKGTETYIWAVDKNDAKVNSVSQNNEYYGEIDSTSNISLPDPNDPAEKARMLVYAQHYFRKSLNLATLIQDQFSANGRISRGVKQRNDKGIWVLQATGMPSVLVEIGFISNREEEKYINSDKGQDEIVSNVLAAFSAYAGRQDSRLQAPDSSR
ncbi:MAG TPA: N-acetylmuramoyl-L-alanine amidase [Chitinophagaceae bacterium]|nr:N-acetylmuramoyl-L-alanine amidase [Chitinophagaceae bacterium]